ncbi:hypothetical protein [Longimicrobium sp.]|uniref:hypothetical protein n=1 Tax=Longimicrobium sp. TaxID=2029185 RepID=UPI002E307B6B|nr:hypothetical protein [Longimicrobium sp.]HEX6041773.1 hypothetical protein [Longimicrobium sp.]
MPSPALDADARGRLQSELLGLEGIRRVIVDDDAPLRIWLVCERTDAPVEMLVRSILARDGLRADDAEVHVSYLAMPEPRRRVRFVSARMAMPRFGRARAEVELEWGGQTFADAVEGETGNAMELRHAAQATLGALAGILNGRMQFSLVGIKSVRAFDTDLVVVLLRTDNVNPLIGASLATSDTYRSAALAVLNATNRVLGNYLSNVENS